MPIIFDEVTADVTPPPAPTTSSNELRGDNARPGIDPAMLVRELQRIAERAERLNAD